MRIPGIMTDLAQKLFDDIEAKIKQAQQNPGSAPAGQAVPIAVPPSAVIQPPSIAIPQAVVIPTDLPWMANAKKELGVTEVPGPGNNPRILWYHSFCTLQAKYDSISWCSAFANAMMITGGIKGTRSAAALDWEGWGIELKYAVYGCLSIWNWGNGHGHVGYVLEADDERGLKILGGNQHDAATNTDKVCAKWFPWSLAPESFQWPKEIALPSDAEVDNG